VVRYHAPEIAEGMVVFNEARCEPVPDDEIRCIVEDVAQRNADALHKERRS
jgi:hypothetical protein